MAAEFLADLQRAPDDAPALSDGVRRLAFRELRRAIEQERGWLADHAVQRCALLADNGVSWIVSELALLASGAINVPLPGYFTPAQMRHVLDDAGIEFVLTDRHVPFSREHDQFAFVDRSETSGLALLRRPTAPCVPIPANVAKVTYTSGSTGAPKGVCLSAAAIDAVATSLVTALTDLRVTRHMAVLPLATLLENIAGVYVPLRLGAEVVVEPTSAIGMSYEGVDAAAFLQAIERQQPHSLVLVPELLRLLVHASSRGWQAPRSLKFIAVGGASVAVELLANARDCGLPVFEGYGLSECASVVCLNTPAASRPGSVGRPLPHARVRIDANGEICVAGAAMSGYLGEPDTAVDEIRTGDLGEIDADGFLYVRGRAKNMFITSMGRNVTPEWVERELTCEPVIAQAMVIGEARPFAVALVSTTADVPRAAVDAAIARANARLPDYAQVRGWTLFPQRPSHASGLATANGRLRRDVILERFGALIEPLYASPESLAHVLS